MNALILDGSICADSSCDAAKRELVNQLQVAGGEIETIVLREAKIAPCAGCFGCWVKTPGVCVINDVGRDIARRVVQCDLVVMLTPLKFGCYSSELKKACDRLIPIISPFFMKVDGEIHHQKRYKRYPRLLGLATCALFDEDAADIFTTLVKRNAINWHSPAAAAGVLAEDQDKASWAGSIQALLNQVGVEA